MTVAFPPRDETLRFTEALDAQYRDELGRGEEPGVHVNWDGIASWTQEYLRLRVNGSGHEAAVQAVQRAVRRAAGIEAPLPPAAALRGRLRASGRHIVDAQGVRWPWRGMSAFRLLELVATGREADAIAALDWAAGTAANVVRVFSMCSGLFRLDRYAGYEALPRLLELAGARGLYVQLVGLVDTDAAGLSTAQMREHLARLAGQADRVEHLVLETANEPDHPTQEPDVVGFVRSWAPSSAVLYAQGAAHGSEDESRAYTGGAYVTVHLDRGRDRWNRERRVRELELLSGEVGKPVISNEPIGAAAQAIDGKRDNLPDVFRAQAYLAAICGTGTTLHSESGLHARVPDGLERACHEAWADGVRQTQDWIGGFRNATWPDSPVKSFDESRAVRVYSSVWGNQGRALSIGGDGRPVMQHGWWPEAELYRSESLVLWRLTQ